jgi:hypothetical protein
LGPSSLSQHHTPNRPNFKALLLLAGLFQLVQ